MIKISPSILSADFANLGQEVNKISLSGADYIHIDVMDGSFVPNITIGSDVIKSIKKHSNIPFDVHLMINNPQNYIKNFVDSGSDIITVHAEAVTHLDRVVKQIKSFGKKVGVSLIPSSNESMLDYVIEELDLILIMTVNPGFGGQKFLSSQLRKIENVRNKVEKLNKNIEIEVDGGIDDKIAPHVINAGANVLVSGSFIFKHENYKEGINKLRLR